MHEENRFDDAATQHYSDGRRDVPPVHEYNASGRSPFLFTCDHYGG
jgi:hypothetical protein